MTTLPAHTSLVQWDEIINYPPNSAISASFSTADAAHHGYDLFLGIVSDNRLETPDMDLSAYGAPELIYDGFCGWTGYMVHTGGAAIGASYIEVSTDAGATYTQIWQEAAVVDYATVGIVEDLAAYANQSQVRIAFHYEGEYAHEWGLDNVMVDNNGPTGPSLSISGSCPERSSTRTVEEACKLGEVGFERVCDVEGVELFKQRK